MASKIHPKQADSIIKSLEAGVVPKIGLQHLLVGRKAEVAEIVNSLDNIAAGQSDVRFWVGDFGSGKSFMLKTIENLALQKNFVVATVDLSPERRFYASDKKAKALYSEIINNLACQTAREGALAVIIERWLEKIKSSLASDTGVSQVQSEIVERINQLHAGSFSYEIGQAIAKYYQGMVEQKIELKVMALRWLTADIETKTEAKQELGIKRVINDDNWYDALKSLSQIFVNIGYAGLVVNFDEMVNLYKIPRSATRERNYEKILNIYNELKTDAVGSILVNFAATNKTVYDQNRGMSSYGALKGRLGKQGNESLQLVNTSKTVLQLKPLTTEEIYVLLAKLSDVYNVYHRQQLEITEADISLYMEEQLNRPGAAEFLTPRAVIKDYLEVLDLVRQNSEVEIDEIIAIYFGRKPKLEFGEEQEGVINIY